MKKNILLFLLAIIVIGCDKKEKTESETEDPEVIIEEYEAEIEKTGADEFWVTLSSFCGKAFEGKVVKAPANDDFTGKKLVMHLLSCDEEFILIPFNVGENRSRTWLLHKKDGRIELKHDHRLSDGADDPVTMYGGTTTNSGLADIQVFPADEETIDIIPAAATNVWWITIKDSIYTYNLRRLGTDREFSVAFDLKKPVEIPEASWGWEEEE